MPNAPMRTQRPVDSSFFFFFCFADADGQQMLALGEILREHMEIGVGEAGAIFVEGGFVLPVAVVDPVINIDGIGSHHPVDAEVAALEFEFQLGAGLVCADSGGPSEAEMEEEFEPVALNGGIGLRALIKQREGIDEAGGGVLFVRDVT